MKFSDVLNMEDVEDFKKLSLRERFQRFAQSDEMPNLKITFAWNRKPQFVCPLQHTSVRSVES